MKNLVLKNWWFVDDEYFGKDWCLLDVYCELVDCYVCLGGV